jgi:sirohydrochlorin cobaltochelatase
VLPLFMASQGHVEGTIVPMVDQLRESLGSIEVELLPPVGQHPSFLKVLREIWTEGLE